MARSWQHSPWRRLAMQASMWVILAATVGLAALVNRQKERASRIPMSEPILLEGMSIRLPATWTQTARIQRGIEEIVVAQEQAADAGHSARRIEITRRRLDTPLSPHEFLLRHNLLPSLQSPTQLLTHGGGTVQFGPYRGIMTTATIVQANDRRAVEIKDISAVVMLPTRDALALHLQGIGRVDYDDEQVIRQIAATLVLEKQPKESEFAGKSDAGSGAGVVTIGSTRVELPDDYTLLSESDPNITERHAVRGRSERLVSVTLVPCVFFPTDGADRVSSMMASRGIEWWRCGSTFVARGRDSGSQASEEAATTAPAASAEFEFAPLGHDPSYRTQAYLKADASGQAVLAIFHGLSTELKSCEAEWEAIAATIQFDKDVQPAQWFKTGAAESKRIAQQDAREFIGNPTEEWWIWRHAKSDWKFGWTHAQYTRPGAAAGSWDLRWRESMAGSVGQLKFTWEIQGPTIYRRAMQRRELEKGTEAQEIFTQAIVVDRGRVTTSIAPLKPAQWKAPVAEQFVPGAYLPLVLGKLEKRPMILSSDTAGGCEGLPMVEPWMLLVRPEAGDVDGGKCVSVEVNGSGRRSRWYFKADGTLSHVDFAGGVRRMRSDARDVQEVFGGDDNDMRVR